MTTEKCVTLWEEPAVSGTMGAAGESAGRWEPVFGVGAIAVFWL
jgi:hypothetical protein